MIYGIHWDPYRSLIQFFFEDNKFTTVIEVGDNRFPESVALTFRFAQHTWFFWSKNSIDSIVCDWSHRLLDMYEMICTNKHVCSTLKQHTQNLQSGTTWPQRKNYLEPLDATKAAGCGHRFRWRFAAMGQIHWFCQVSIVFCNALLHFPLFFSKFGKMFNFLDEIIRYYSFNSQNITINNNRDH